MLRMEAVVSVFGIEVYRSDDATRMDECNENHCSGYCFGSRAADLRFPHPPFSGGSGDEIMVARAADHLDAKNITLSEVIKESGK
jgi:hypothetical protein